MSNEERIEKYARIIAGYEGPEEDWPSYVTAAEGCIRVADEEIDRLADVKIEVEHRLTLRAEAAEREVEKLRRQVQLRGEVAREAQAEVERLKGELERALTVAEEAQAGESDHCAGPGSLVEQHTLARAALSQPEPEYEYSFTSTDGYQSGMRFDTFEEAQRSLDHLRRPHDWLISRRAKAGATWEVVQ